MITHSFTAKIVMINDQQCSFPVEAALSYDAEHAPLAVQIVFDSADMDDAVTWVFSRDLLVQATNSQHSVGEGDVKLRAIGERHLGISLCSPEGHAALYLPIGRIREFLADTTEEAAQCQDALSVAVDHLLAEVLG